MRKLTPQRRRAALCGSLAAGSGSSSILLRNHMGSGSHLDFFVGLTFGVAAGVAVLLLGGFRNSSCRTDGSIR